MQAFGFWSVEDNLVAREDFLKKKQIIANEILYRLTSLKFDLRSTVQAPEVSKGQGP